MTFRGLALLMLIPAVAGCASEESSAGGTHRSDAALPDARSEAPPEARFIRLTIDAIYNWQESETGVGEAVAVDGVRVCVARARPWGGAWQDFVETAGPCTTSVANERVVLEGAPGVSELIVTAEKDGYMPSAFAVTTDRWDMDTTLAGRDQSLHIRRRDAPWATLPAGEPVSPDLGVVEAMVISCTIDSCWSLGGAGVAMVPPLGRGPFYWKDGRVDPTAMRTPSGGLFSRGGTSGVSFANVPQGGYDLVVDIEGAPCVPLGWFYGDTILGFASTRKNAIGVPVLAGHLTTAIRASCTCSVLDSGTCAPAGSDASPPP